LLKFSSLPNPTSSGLMSNLVICFLILLTNPGFLFFVGKQVLSWRITWFSFSQHVQDGAGGLDSCTKRPTAMGRIPKGMRY